MGILIISLHYDDRIYSIHGKKKLLVEMVILGIVCYAVVAVLQLVKISKFLRRMH